MSSGKSFMAKWLNKAKTPKSKPASGSASSSAPVPKETEKSPPRVRKDLSIGGRRLSAPRAPSPSPNDVNDVEVVADRKTQLQAEFKAFGDAEDASSNTRKRRLSEDAASLNQLSSARSKKSRSVRRIIEDSDEDDDEELEEVPVERNEASAARRLVVSDDEDVDVPLSKMRRSNQDVQMVVDDRDDNDVEMSPLKLEQDVAKGDFDFGTLMYTKPEEGAEPSNVALPEGTEEQCLAVRKKLKNVGFGDGQSEVEKSWNEKHPWSVDIKDSKGRRPGETGYDKTTLLVPSRLFGKGKDKLTPFAQQYWKIKSKHFDVIIFFKKGKFYEIFDRDADLAHKLLGLTWTKNLRADMRYCGVPECRFTHFASRLIEMGYKVGRVEQTESAAGQQQRKKSGGGGSTCCERNLVEVLTRATVTSETMLRNHNSRYVLSLMESGFSEDESESEVRVAICTVDAAGGAVTVRELTDDFRRTETERALASLRPREIVIDEGSLSPRVIKLVRHMADRLDADIIDTLPDAFSPLTDKLLNKYLDPETGVHKRLSKYLADNELASCALGAMQKYLAHLLIDKELLSLENYSLSPEVSSMTAKVDEMEVDAGGTEADSRFSFKVPSQLVRMDAPTLNSLELVANANDGGEKGSLLSYLNKASTPAGKRLLRRWTAEPLANSEDILCRLQSVTSFIHLEHSLGGFGFDEVSKKLKGKCDLERAIPRLHKQATVADTAVMYSDMNKKRVQQFFNVLNSIKSVLAGVESLREAIYEHCNEPKHQSARLNWLVKSGGAIPANTMNKLNFFFSDAYDFKKAESDGIIVPSEGAAPEYDEKKNDIALCEKELNDQLNYWRRKLRDNNVQFFHQGQNPYQLEVPKKVFTKFKRPAELICSGTTKKVDRFYTPKLKELVNKKILAEEAFDEAKKNVIREVVRKFDVDYEVWSAVAQTASELDALMGLARTSLGDGIGPMCRPDVLPNDHPHPVLEASELRHPVLSSKAENFVSNDVILGGEEKPIAAVLTGVNAGGKSTLSRQVAVCALLAQIGCYVPASSFKFRPFKDVYVRMGASDDIARGLSTFMVEMEDVSNILNNANKHSLVIADEVGRGTSTHDGYAIAYATLTHLVNHAKCMCVFSTHYHMLGKDIAVECTPEERKRVGVYEMAAVMDEGRKEITFLYKFQEGISTSSRGICCARLAGVPAEVADAAEVAAEEFEHHLAGSSLVKAIVDAADDDSLARALSDKL